jgi:DHA2 family multidrug resistance protein-like MFS transporter
MAGEVPAGVPLEAAQTARDTLGGAIEVAGQVPGQLGTALVDAAREAFMAGLHVAATISAIGSIGIALLVVTLLRHVRTGAGEEVHEDAEPRTFAPGNAAGNEIPEPATAEC